MNQVAKLGLTTLQADQICDNVIRRLHGEEVFRFFQKAQIKFAGASVSFGHNHAVIINFKTLRHKHRKSPSSPRFYRVLVLFQIHEQALFSDENLSLLLQDLEHLKQQENIAQFILFADGTRTVSSHAISLLKRNSVHVIFLDGKMLSENHIMSGFVIDNKFDDTINFAINLVADEIVKRLKKLFHIVLSDVVAPVYDKIYAAEKFATALTMKKEEDLVDEIVSDLAATRSRSTQDLIAVDVGTGTGRHAFRLSRCFSRIYAFDISSQMIEVAKQKKRDRDDKRTSFSVADFEYEEVDGEKEFIGKVDFVCASFGMGSFVEDTAGMLRRFQGWLKPGGAVLISFYNSNTIVQSMKPTWTDTSLAAHIDADRQTLQVTLEDMVFQVYCKPYTSEMKQEIETFFDIRKLISYPSISAIMPNSIFQTKNAKKYFSHLDDLLLKTNSYFNGHYTLVYGIKRREGSSGVLTQSSVCALVG